MLESVTLKNVAIMEDVTVPFNEGLNVITGPTGSGKSLLIQGLQMALGRRADYDLISDDSDRAKVSTFFNVDNDTVELPEFVTTNDLNMRRLLKSSRSSSAYLNDERVRLDTLRDLRSHLIDFHGQHENQAVFQSDFPRRVLDRFGEYDDQLSTYRNCYTDYEDLKSQLESLRNPDSNHQQRIEFLEYQLSELDEFEPGENEWEEIEERRHRLESAEQIDEQIRTAISNLEGEEAPHHRLNAVVDYLRDLVEFEEELSDWIDELDDYVSGIKELQRQLKQTRDKFDHSEQEYDDLMARRGEWLELARKHNVPPEQLFDRYQSLNNELETLRNRDQKIERLESKLSEIKPTLREHGEALTERRIETAEELETEVEQRLDALNLAESIFRVSVQSSDPGPHGLDDVNWLFASHHSQEPGPLSERVSGGEISRVLLAVKSALAGADTTPTLVFDEIDTGISGKEAESVGQVLSRLSEFHQVICITHLPLVASHADHHVVIERKETSETVNVNTRVVEDDQRLDELSRLLSGDRESEVSRDQARELLDKSGVTT